MREAYAWLQNRLVGRFFEGSDGATRFEYAPEASMPHQPFVAARWLLANRCSGYIFRRHAAG